jgi:glucose-1-phosphate adenylyltransferase
MVVSIQASKIERSVIGIRSRIGNDTVIVNTYMMGSDTYESLEEIEEKKIDILVGVGERCYIKNAIIDKNCRIGDDVKIHGGPDLADEETDTYFIKDGIVVIKKDAVIPKGTIIQ